MSEQFDPYHIWLGIRPEEQPVNHYRLLGITPFEDNPEVIRDAAMQRMAHVRLYQLGQYQALTQKILNELGGAKACLLDPEQRAAYDAELKSKMDKAASSTGRTKATTPDPLAFLESTGSTDDKAKPEKSATPRTATPREDAARLRPAPKLPFRFPAIDSKWSRKIIIGSGIGGLLGLVLILWLVFGGSRKEATVAQALPSGDQSVSAQARKDRSASTAASNEKSLVETHDTSSLSLPPKTKEATADAGRALDGEKARLLSTEVKVHDNVPSAPQPKAEESSASAVQPTDRYKATPQPAQLGSEPVGSMCLFDGKSLSGWHPRQPNGPLCWNAQAGELVGTAKRKPRGGRDDLITDQLFQDFELHLDFLLKPEANSGVYLRGRYEVQLYDVVGAVAPDSSCGAIYRLIAPAKDAYLGSGKWNSLDVKLVGRQVTVVMNGERIIDSQRIVGPTGGAIDSLEDQPGPVMLQCHTGQFRFRNIRIRPIKSASVASNPIPRSEVTTRQAGSIPPDHKPELVEVSELNGEGRNEWPSLTEDGLTIYWTRNGSMIWTAHRNDPQSFFTNKKELFHAKMAAISSDGLEMILASERTDGQKDTYLHVTTRNAPDKMFKRPSEIPELREFVSFDPFLSTDGLTLYFCSRKPAAPDTQSKVVYSTRKDKSSLWTEPKLLPNVATDDGVLWGPFVTRDGLHLFLEHYRKPSSTFMMWSRASVKDPFERYQYPQLGGLPLLHAGVFRYVAATNELFYEKFPGKSQGARPKIGIWVIKNFVLPVE